METNDELVDYLVLRGVLRSSSIIKAFRHVDRKLFVPGEFSKLAYYDEPLPIGEGQTISQPSTVALMTEFLLPEKGNRVLEIGSGSGYQAALLSRIIGPTGKVITVEMVEKIFNIARKNLNEFGNVETVLCDGSLGYEKESPYDRIIVTAASPGIPAPLKEQLKDGGRMVIPVGKNIQEMTIVTKHNGKFDENRVGEFLFVPLLGKHGFE